MEENKPKAKFKPHHIGLAALLSLAPGYYGIKQASDFFYTRREAYIELKRIHENEKQMRLEARENNKALLEWMQSVDGRIITMAIDVGVIKGTLNRALNNAYRIKKNRQQGG